MLYREIMAVCSQIHTKHIYTVCGQNVELLNVKLVVQTQCGTKVLGLTFFKKPKAHKEGIPFFYSKQTSLPYIQAFARSYSLWKAAENSSFWTFFNSSVTASWISATSGTSFSTWGKGNSPSEINLESTGVIKVCNIVLGQKLPNSCSFVGGCIIVQEDIISNAAGRTRWMSFRRRSIIPLQNSAFTVFPSGTNSLSTALWESKKLSTCSSCGTLGISVYSAEGMSHQPTQNSVTLFQGRRQNTSSHLL